MASPTTPSSPTQAQFDKTRRRTNTASSVARSVFSVAEDLVLHHDPPVGFFAGTAEAAVKVPSIGEIRRGSFGRDGRRQNTGSSNAGSGSNKRRTSSGDSHFRSQESTGSGRQGELKGQQSYGPNVPIFAPLTEEPAEIGEDFRQEFVGLQTRQIETKNGIVEADELSASRTAKSSIQVATGERTDHDRISGFSKDKRVYTSGYVPPPKIPWSTSTLIALKAFWRWFTTPFGFLLTIYGLNVVAWGGMLFLLLCNASPAMCWAPKLPYAYAHVQRSPAASLALKKPGVPLYYNCNDINSPRRIWIEIDSQILNALFCVTGFGLVPWRFRDLYYLLRWRLTSLRRQGREKKMYGLRVLAGIHRGWFRLPGSETLDNVSTEAYRDSLSTMEDKSDPSNPVSNTVDLEANMEAGDPRIPLPISKRPDDPITSVRAPATKLWLLDFFIWCQCWNTFFQCCLCGFMWGMNRYTRPPWATGLFVALACIIAGAGGVASFVEGKKVSKVEGVASSRENDALIEKGDDMALQHVNTGRESILIEQKGKSGDRPIQSV